MGGSCAAPGGRDGLDGIKGEKGLPGQPGPRVKLLMI